MTSQPPSPQLERCSSPVVLFLPLPPFTPPPSSAHSLRTTEKEEEEKEGGQRGGRSSRPSPLFFFFKAPCPSLPPFFREGERGAPPAAPIPCRRADGLTEGGLPPSDRRCECVRVCRSLWLVCMGQEFGLWRNCSLLLLLPSFRAFFNGG